MRDDKYTVSFLVDSKILDAYRKLCNDNGQSMGKRLRLLIKQDIYLWTKENNKIKRLAKEAEDKLRKEENRNRNKIKGGKRGRLEKIENVKNIFNIKKDNNN